MSDFVSYAQNFEDVILWRALKDVSQGFYVDVGAQHPLRDSVTRAFYERGWRGVNIDPIAAWHGLLNVDRPEDVNLRVALGAESGDAVFYEVQDTGLSTMDSRLAAQHSAQGHVVHMDIVPMRTLDSVLDEYAPAQIHFLKIDVEGAEEAVLRGLSLDRYRPWIVVVEATLPNSQIDISENWASLIQDAGYESIYFDGLNRFFLAQEHAELRRHFQTPPNYFDSFVRYPDWERGELARRLGEEMEVQRATEQSLTERISQLAAEHEQFRAERERLEAEHAQTLADMTHAFEESMGHAQRELDDTRSQVQAERERAAAELAYAVSAQEALRAELEAARQQLESVNASVQQLLVERGQQARLRAELDYRERAMAMLQASRSWRLTAPLRWFSNLVGAAREFEHPPQSSEDVGSEAHGHRGVPDEASLLVLASTAPVPRPQAGPSVSSLPSLPGIGLHSARFDTVINELKSMLRPPQALPPRLRTLPGASWVARPMLRIYERLFRKQQLFNARLLEALEMLKDERR